MEEQKGSCDWERCSETLQEKVSQLPQESPIKPMPVNPWRGQNASLTKREREEKENGDGETNVQFTTVPLPSPTALPPPSSAARRPFKRPRLSLPKVKEEKEESLECKEDFIVPGTPQFSQEVELDEETRDGENTEVYFVTSDVESD